MLFASNSLKIMLKHRHYKNWFNEFVKNPKKFNAITINFF